MTRYVIGPEVALRLARDEVVIPDEHQLLAPTLLRSQMLSLLYRATRQGEMAKNDADRQLNHVRALRIRLLGDRVLQRVAWKIADQLGWPDTFEAVIGTMAVGVSALTVLALFSTVGGAPFVTPAG